MKPAHATRLGLAFRWAAVLVLGVGYSVASHLAAASPTPTLLGALVAIVPLIGLALVMAWRSAHRPVLLALCVAACVALFSILDWLVAHYNWVFLLQHVGINALLFLAFARTLQSGHTPMVTGFARIVHGTLSPALIRYTRAATVAWSAYFAVVMIASLLLFWLAPVTVWSAFANLLTAPMLAVMFAGEYIVRCLVLPASERAGPLEAIRAYRQSQAAKTARRP